MIDRYSIVGLSAVLLALSGGLPALAVEETAEGFAAAMQGCWNQAEVENGSNQLCLNGGVEGVMAVVYCLYNGDLTECSQMDGTYAFRDEKFWRSYGESGWLTGGTDNCDVRFGPGQKFELHNCAWTTVPPSGRPPEDAVYEKATGQ